VRTSFNTITAGLDRRLEDIIEACGKSRFEGMEIDLRALEETAGRVKTSDVRRMLDDRGIAAASVMAFDLAPFAKDDEAYDRFRRGVDAAKVVGAPILLTYCAARKPEQMSLEVALDTAGERACRYAEAAAPLKVALEPIGGSDFMGGPKRALDIARRSSAANVGIMMDTFHYYKSNVPDEDILAIPRDMLLIVHVSDSQDLPRDQLRDSHRVHVGRGILPLDRDLKLIRSIGYDGFFSVEIFNEDYWREPAEEVVEAAKQALDAWLTKGA
jgi:sugar phosphate isomerase/epimerase